MRSTVNLFLSYSRRPLERWGAQPESIGDQIFPSSIREFGWITLSPDVFLTNLVSPSENAIFQESGDLNGAEACGSKLQKKEELPKKIEVPGFTDVRHTAVSTLD